MVSAEAQKRFDLAERLSVELAPHSKSVILVGSVAHSPEKVTIKSDVDLLVIIEDLASVICKVPINVAARDALKNRVFDGYCTKEVVEDVPVSIHFLSDDAFDVITKCNVADIRVYRPDPKEGDYKLLGFEGQEYPYWIKNVSLREMGGSRTIVPVSFIAKDRYYIGIHRDKLLSMPRIMYDRDGNLPGHIDTLWVNVVRNLIAESKRLYGVVDLKRMSVWNALSRKDKMSAETKANIMEKTRDTIAKLDN